MTRERKMNGQSSVEEHTGRVGSHASLRMEMPCHVKKATTCQRSMPSTFLSLFVLIVLFVATASAAKVDFVNCLSTGTKNSNPRLLQFTPLHVEAFFNTSSPKSNLNFTVYGNVSGRTTVEALPPPGNPQWSNPDITLGKIVDLSTENNKYTTLFSRFNVLSYTPWKAAPARFCQASIHGKCPIAPAFFVNTSDLARLPAFTVAHDMFSSYAFTSITASLSVVSGDLQGSDIACITASITPALGAYLDGVLRYLPMAILIVVALATVISATLSPWGSLDLFRWTTNFGRDEDLLRLVTPGFGDCLQYIQFIVLTGSLSLNYPGFYQPAVSRVGWSSLMFNESFATGGNGTQVVTDGIYEYRSNTTYGMDRMSQLIGMHSPRDVWTGMIVWLVVIVGAVAVLTQVGFAARYLYHHVTSDPAEDLRSKNWPFTAGNVIRTVLNFFILPLVSLSMFQLVIAGQGPTYGVALAAIVVVSIIAFAGRLMYLFNRTRPRSFLFDDLLTVLTYGPLYNTYCDDAATFALIPILINLLRGIAIGAVQPSGIAQIVLLAICEIILVLTLNAFRPFPTASSMNIYHTFFASVRLVTILLSIAFVPSLGVSESSRGWLGYAILLVHACVLVFGFFLNAVQTLIEVIARLAGAGGRNEIGGPARGGLTRVFGMRQLSRRLPRRADQNSRHSMASNAAMLALDADQKSLQLENARSRSISASSTMLLAQGQRQSQGFGPASPGQISGDGTSMLSRPRTNTRLSGSGTMSPTSGGILGLKQVESKDPYYRQPRRNTMEPTAPADKKRKRSSLARSAQFDEEAIEDDVGEGASTAPVQSKEETDDSELALSKTNTDYAVREVDFYYGVRGPALSSGTRKLKTGPADPTGPVSSATGWFKGLFGAQTKENGKGFEVVRSARAPPPGLMPPTPEEAMRGQPPDPYHDNPETPERARRDIGMLTPQPARRHDQEETDNDDDDDDDDFSDDESVISRVPTQPPSLPYIDAGNAIELPSRLGSQVSKASKKGQNPLTGRVPSAPAIPRKSSRRLSSQDAPADFPRQRLPTVMASPPNSKRNSRMIRSSSGRIPFQTSHANPSKSNRYSTGVESTMEEYMHDTHMDGEENHVPTGAGHLRPDQAGVPAERPTSMGFVTQHRASDNIYYSPDSVEGRAEVYGEPARRGN